jgi:hypothetical protein
LKHLALPTYHSFDGRAGFPGGYGRIAQHLVKLRGLRDRPCEAEAASHRSHDAKARAEPTDTLSYVADAFQPALHSEQAAAEPVL